MVIGASHGRICLCDWIRDDGLHPFYLNYTGSDYDKRVLERAVKQIDEYFCRERRSFDLPLYLGGTEFQQKVWSALLAIPYGQTNSYGKLAMEIGSPKSCRAVAGAAHRNPVSIIVPCHRLIGADGSLTGYASGIDRKRYLLNLEKS